jgi:hypothetical protein
MYMEFHTKPREKSMKDRKQILNYAFGGGVGLDNERSRI